MFDKKKHWGMYYEKNKKRLLEKAKKYRKENKEKVSEAQRRWHKNNPGYQREYRKNNLEKVRKWRNDRKNERYRTDVKYNIGHKMRAGIRQSLKKNKNGHHWEALVGYTLDDLVRHLKKTIPRGYKWEDIFGNKLHIDHIVPISAFNYTNPKHPDFKKCWALSNLRLLPAGENEIKHNKLYKPFQPSLKINI